MGYDDWKTASPDIDLSADEPIAEYDGPTCIYCGEPCAVLDNHEPFCSALCACYADIDNMEDR